MDIYEVKNNISVMGVTVNDFPNGISEAFNRLVKEIPGGFSRSYYGVSHHENGIFVYKAAAEVKAGEPEIKYYQRFVIEKGKYLVAIIRNWRNHTSSIQDVFHMMMQDKRVDLSKPCIEWYKNEEEMYCMIAISEN